MAHFIESTVAENPHLGRRVFAKLDAKVSWEDKSLGEPRTVYGTTENLSGNSTLVGVDVLPPVGQAVSLTLFDGKKEIIRIPAVVIRVVRDPAKPKAALSIGEKLDMWREKALTAAQAWATRDIKINYEGDDWLN